MKRTIHYWLFAIGYWLTAGLPALAQDFGLTQAAKEAGFKTGGAVGGPATVAGKIVGYLLAFVGIIFFALMLYGGILWMTARGNEEKVKKAQELIKSAVIGLVIVFLSYVVTNFVLSNLLRSTA